jgi:hypothetical protein
MRVNKRREQDASEEKSSLREAIASEREAAFWQEYHLRKRHNEEKTARLRALRLAKAEGEREPQFTSTLEEGHSYPATRSTSSL